MCGKEEVLPFRCSYCQGYFCADHKLPENHQCPALPKAPLFWYQKKRKTIESTEGGRRIGTCPKCGQGSNEMIDYDAKTMSFECKRCGYKYIQLKRFPYDIIESKDVLESTKELKRPKPRKPETKETKPKTIHRRTVRKTLRNVKTVGVFIISLIIVGVFIFSWTNFFAQIIMPHTVDTAEIETEIFQIINEERADRGLPALFNDEALATIALDWSKHLAETGDLTHGDFEVRIASIGYLQYECGEIIGMYGGWSQRLGREFVDMWLESQGHRQIMLTPSGGYMGVGVSKGDEGFFAVVDFRFT